MYYGSANVSNESFIQLIYDGSNDDQNLRLKYGSNNNNLEFETPVNSIVEETWQHIMVSYDGGTTGSASGSVGDYYSRFKIFIDGVEQVTLNSNRNFGTTQSVNPIVFRIGRYTNGQSLRNNTKVDELALWGSDQSANINEIYNSGSPRDLSLLTSPPEHWWRMGDGDVFPFLDDSGSVGNCTFVMQNMNIGDIVSDVP